MRDAGVTPDIAELINARRSSQTIKPLALQQGMKMLAQNAIALALEGKTSKEEVLAFRLD